MRIEAIEEGPEAIATKEDGGDQDKQDFGRFEFMGVNFSGLIKAPCFLGQFLSAGGASGQLRSIRRRDVTRAAVVLDGKGRTKRPTVMKLFIADLAGVAVEQCGFLGNELHIPAMVPVRF